MDEVGWEGSVARLACVWRLAVWHARCKSELGIKFGKFVGLATSEGSRGLGKGRTIGRWQEQVDVSFCHRKQADGSFCHRKQADGLFGHRKQADGSFGHLKRLCSPKGNLQQ
eukprot:365938-Chlamydomonas_euryale.AAC.3